MATKLKIAGWLNRPSRAGQDQRPDRANAVDFVSRATTGGECRIVEVRMNEAQFADLIRASMKAKRTPGVHLLRQYLTPPSLPETTCKAAVQTKASVDDGSLIDGVDPTLIGGA